MQAPVPTVREATPDDAEAILELHVAAIRAFGPDAYDDEQVDAWATKEDGADAYPIEGDEPLVVVAERAEDVVAYGQLDREGGEVTAVYVHPDRAREGVGSAVLSHLEDAARAAGVDELNLLASRNAVPFYERHGYETVAAVTHETTGGVELECVEMEKTLQ